MGFPGNSEELTSWKGNAIYSAVKVESVFVCHS